MLYCKSCKTTVEVPDEIETDIECPCGCGGNLIMLVCPYCGSKNLTPKLKEVGL